MSNPEWKIRVVLYPGSHHSGAISVSRHHKGVIDGDPVLYVIPESLETEIGVVFENSHELRVAPSAEGLLQVVWQVPVVERDHRLHADLLQLLNERPVVVGADFVVTATGTVGKNPGPGQRKSVVADPELFNGSDVSVDVVVAVAAHVSGDHSGAAARKSVPNGEPLPVLFERALHLVRGRAHRPYEVLGEGVIEESLVCRIGQLIEATPGFQAGVRLCSHGGEEAKKCHEGEQSLHGSRQYWLWMSSFVP